MSAMIISSQFGEYHRVERPLRRGGVGSSPNYAARRLGAVLVVLASIVVAVGALNAVVSSFEAQPVSAAGAQSGSSDATPGGLSDAVAGSHVASAGDTLWSIADEHRGEVNRDRFVDALVRLNGGTRIFVGQAVILP